MLKGGANKVFIWSMAIGAVLLKKLFAVFFRWCKALAQHKRCQQGYTAQHR